MPFADFHVHGSFKTFLSGYAVKEKLSPWQEVQFRADRLLFATANRVLGSQSCFRQLFNGDLKLAVVPLYCIERAFPSSFLLKLVNTFSSKINDRLFKHIRDDKITYWQQLNDCYKHLLRAATDNETGHERVNFTRCFEDFKEGMINIVFSMEGAHCFLDKDADVATPDGMDKILQRLKIYKQRNAVDNHPRLFILNLIHLTQGPFCNHAFGMKLISHRDFIPFGRSLSLAGLKILEAALSYDKDHYPLIVDIKHMSLESRKEFYKIRRTSFPKVPITASHAGCTGISWDHIPDYIKEINSPILNKRKCNLITYSKPKGVLPNTEFNPWSINLYDEDIAEILTSGGLIGLSLDQRVLGSGFIAREKTSKAETFKGVAHNHPLVARDPGEKAPIKDAELHFRHFCNNIFQVVKVAESIHVDGVNPWKQIVIGSDFDGLIDAVDFCTTAEQYKNIEDLMRAQFADLAIEAGLELPADVNGIINDLLYNNALSFLKKYYSVKAFAD